MQEKATASPDDMRSLYERAVEACGTDLRMQNHIWDNYVKYETSQGEHARVATIYRRVVAVPLVSLDDVWSRFVQFSQQQPPSVLATPSELQASRSAVPAICETLCCPQQYAVEAGEGEEKVSRFTTNAVAAGGERAARRRYRTFQRGRRGQPLQVQRRPDAPDAPHPGPRRRQRR